MLTIDELAEERVKIYHLVDWLQSLHSQTPHPTVCPQDEHQLNIWNKQTAVNCEDFLKAYIAPNLKLKLAKMHAEYFTRLLGTSFHQEKPFLSLKFGFFFWGG